MKRTELSGLIKTLEGYTLEFKGKPSNSIAKEICAFANASGGKIILGVKDDSTIVGYNLSNVDISRISQETWNHLFLS